MGNVRLVLKKSHKIKSFSQKKQRFSSFFFFSFFMSNLYRKLDNLRPKLLVSNIGTLLLRNSVERAEEDLKRAVKIYSRLLKKASNSRFWRFFLGIKKK
jgi:hypothetical protein